MHRYWRIAVLPVVLGLALAACAGPEDVVPGTLKVTTSTKKLDGFSQTTDVWITVLDNEGQAGTGTVSLKAKAGGFAGTGLPEVALPLQAGEAHTVYGCDRTAKVDSGCVGTVSIKATWNEVLGSTSVSILPADAGTSGGTDAGI
jgi:hypothetical protein